MNWSSSWPDPQSMGSKTVPSDDLEDQIISRTEQFTVKNGNKSYTFAAEIIGDLALDYSNDGWNIYHVPTLSLFSKAVPASNTSWLGIEKDEFNYDKSSLLNWMKLVQAEGKYPTAWQMLRQLTPDDYADKSQAAKDIILKWCLSCPVE